jgi:hypothetical protein
VVTKFPNIIGWLAFRRQPKLRGAAKSATEIFQVRAKLLKLRTQLETSNFCFESMQAIKAKRKSTWENPRVFPVLVGNNRLQTSRKSVLPDLFYECLVETPPGSKKPTLPGRERAPIALLGRQNSFGAS